MKLSARNVLAGKVIEVKRGATTSHVRIEIAGGLVLIGVALKTLIEHLA